MTDEKPDDKKNEVVIEVKRSIGGPGITVIDSKISLRSLDSIDDLIQKALGIQDKLAEKPENSKNVRAVKNEPLA